MLVREHGERPQPLDVVLRALDPVAGPVLGLDAAQGTEVAVDGGVALLGLDGRTLLGAELAADAAAEGEDEEQAGAEDEPEEAATVDAGVVRPERNSCTSAANVLDSDLLVLC